LNFTLINSLILAGIIQGFVFGFIYFLSKKYKSKSTVYLALLIILFSYNNLQFYLQDARILTGLSMYRTLYLPVGSLMPVCIYFYALESTIGLDKKYKKPWLFFIPFLVFLVYVIAFKLYNLLTTMTRPVYIKFKAIQDFQSIFSFVYTLVLIGLSYKHIIRYQKTRNASEFRYFEQYTWLKRTLAFLFFLSLFWGFTLFIYLTTDNYVIFFNLLWIGLSIAIYYIGHLGIYKYGLAKERKNIRRFSGSLQKSIALTNSTKNSIVQLKQILVIEKQFLDPKLTLESLANDMKISKSHLSRIFNTELNSSFTHFVNQLRIDQAKLYLSDVKFSKYTLLAIGLEAGFNSKTTFNTTFKKITGMTPSQYRKNNLHI